MLDVDNVVAFLLERGLVEKNWIINGELTIRSVARRNRNLRVEGPGGTGFLIKQPDPAEGGRSMLTLRTESEFLRNCRSELLVDGLARILPRLIDGDVENAVRVYELIPNAVSLLSLVESPDSQGPGIEAAQALGHALGTFHRFFSLTDRGGDPPLSWLSRELPWVMKLHTPGIGILADLSHANIEILRILQTQEGLGDRLDTLRRQWQYRTVIHGDIKFDNILIRPSRAGVETDPVELWVADWEMVRIGDPAWDLAGALQDFLVLWVSSMPLSDELDAEQRINLAQLPLSSLRHATRALWSAYRVASDLDPAGADRFLLRTVAYSAARLIQSAYEMSHGMDRLLGRAVILLQISANLLAEPERGQVQLYGILKGSAV